MRLQVGACTPRYSFFLNLRRWSCRSFRFLLELVAFLGFGGAWCWITIEEDRLRTVTPFGPGFGIPGVTQFLSLQVKHIPGQVNQGVDLLSRGAPSPGEWRLHPEVVEQIWHHFRRANLFTTISQTKHTAHCISPCERMTLPWVLMQWCTNGFRSCCMLSPPIQPSPVTAAESLDGELSPILCWLHYNRSTLSPQSWWSISGCHCCIPHRSYI